MFRSRRRPDRQCRPGMARRWDSTIKVLNPTPNTGGAALIKTDKTDLRGKFRADELSYDPVDQLVLIANDAEGLLTFIDVNSQSVAGHFYYADNTLGAAPSAPGHATAGSGLEQSVFVPPGTPIRAGCWRS